MSIVSSNSAKNCFDLSASAADHDCTIPSPCSNAGYDSSHLLYGETCLIHVINLPLCALDVPELHHGPASTSITTSIAPKLFSSTTACVLSFVKVPPLAYVAPLLGLV